VQTAENGRKFIPAAKVWRERYQVTAMTGWRWENNPDLGFPRPYYIGRFKYFAEDELEAFEQSRPRERQHEECAA
jgi:hypothetical protein